MSGKRNLYDYAKEVHNAEIQAFYDIERKAGQYFSACGLLLSAAGVTIGFSLNHFIPPHGYLKSTLALLSLLIAAGLLSSGFFLFRVLAVAGLRIPPLNDQIINAFTSNTEDEIYEQLSIKMRDATEQNRGVVKRKTQALKRGYWCIFITLVLLALFGVIFVADKWHSASQ